MFVPAGAGFSRSKGEERTGEVKWRFCYVLFCCSPEEEEEEGYRFFFWCLFPSPSSSFFFVGTEPLHQWPPDELTIFLDHREPDSAVSFLFCFDFRFPVCLFQFAFGIARDFQLCLLDLELKNEQWSSVGGLFFSFFFCGAHECLSR